MEHRGALRRHVPATSWLPGYRRSDLRPDLVAGLTAGAMLVPQGMAYAQLAGLPPQVGLYAATVPLLAYAIFGTSRQMSVGPVAVIALLTATALAPLAQEGTAEYVAGAALLALLVGAISVALGLVRLGWITNLLSHSVLVGFTAAVALIIAAGQLKVLLGVKAPRTDGFGETVAELARHLDTASAATALLGLTALAAIVALKRWRKAFPGALVVVAAGIVVTTVFDLATHGVAVVGNVPTGLPGLSWPDLGSGMAADLLPMALTIAVVGYVESIAVAKVYARRNRYDIDPNQELVGLGAANVAAGLFSGQPVTGGFSRTAVNADAGARTPLATLFTAGLIVLTLLFLTPLFENLPQTILAAVVLAAVLGLIEVGEMRHIARVKRSDALTMAVAFVATLALGIEWGIAVAVAASIAVLVARVMNPHSTEVGRLPGTRAYRNVHRFPEAEQVPGVGILRIDVSLSFANVAFLKRRLRQLEADHPEGVRAVVLDGAGINDLDASAEAALSELLTDYCERGVELHLANMKGPVRDVMIRSGLWARLGDHVHPDVDTAVLAIAGEAGAAPVDRRLVGIDERG